MTATMKLVFAGDLCLRQISDRIDFKTSSQILASVQPILDQADCRIVNLENPLTVETEKIFKSGPNLKGERENIAFLEAGRFDCAILANNHLGDYGLKGVTDTLEVLDQHRIGHTGGGRNLDESYLPWFAEANGLRAAVIAVAENEYGGAAYDKPGMAGLRMGKLAETIERAHEKADFVIVVVHGGNEYNPLPSPGVVERYRLITRLGADAVIGMHPHCPQGTERYQGKPIVYSTGNFLFFHENNQDARSSWYYGYLPVLTCQTGQPVGLEIVPYRFDPACTRIDPFDGADKAAMLAYLEKISGLFQDERQREDFFRAWCVRHGPQNAGKLVYKAEYLEDPSWRTVWDFLVVRNLLTCEAHHEVMATLMRVIEEGKVDTYRKMGDELAQLQQMPV